MLSHYQYTSLVSKTLSFFYLAYRSFTVGYVPIYHVALFVRSDMDSDIC